MELIRVVSISILPMEIKLLMKVIPVQVAVVAVTMTFLVEAAVAVE